MAKQSLDPKIIADSIVRRLTKDPEFHSHDAARILSPSATPKIGNQQGVAKGV